MTELIDWNTTPLPVRGKGAATGAIASVTDDDLEGLPENDERDPLDGPSGGLNANGYDGERGGTREPASSVTVAPWAGLVAPAPVEWFTTPPPARAWLLRDSRRSGAPGLLPLGKAGALIAEGGGSKTMALCQLAIAVATGSPFLGTLSVATQGRVLLVLGEEDAEEVHRRLYNATRAGGPTPPEGSIVVLPLAGVPCAMLEADEHGNPRDTAFAHWLLGYVDAETRAGRPFALVVLDPLSRFAGLEAETDNAQATRFVQSVERIAGITGATALVSHHIAKAFRNGAEVIAAASRGSSAFTDGFRFVASLAVQNVSKALESPEERERLGEVVTLSFVKSNYSRKGEPLQLRRDDCGALIPLDELDREAVGKATSGAALRQARAEERESERGARDAAEAARKASVRNAKDAEAAARWTDRERAMVKVLSAGQLGTRELRSAMVAALGTCGREVCDATLVRLGPAVAIGQSGTRKQTHTLRPDALPAHLKPCVSSGATEACAS